MTSGKTGIGHKLPLVTYEFGQTIKTARYPDGVNVHLYDGGTSLDIGQLVSENTLDVMASAGFNLKHAQRASYTELDIDQSSPVTLPNGQASSLAELAEIVYQAFTKVAQKKKFLPTLRRNAPGLMIGLAGGTVAVVGSLAIHPAFIIGVAAGIPAGYVIKRRNAGFEREFAESYQLGETLRFALLEQGKKAGALPLNYGALGFAKERGN